MKFQLTNKKRLLSVSIITLSVALSYYGYNLYQEKQDYQHQIDFVAEYNNSIEEAENNELLTDDNVELIEALNLEKKVSGQKVAAEKEVVQVGEQPTGAKRIIEPYSEPLPPVPDADYVKEHFVDHNANGVRDDVEIKIVEEFGEDRDVVESFFADARNQEKDLYIVDNYLLDFKHIQESIDRDSFVFACGQLYFDNSEFKSELKSNKSWTNHSLEFNYYNTKKREDAFSRLAKKMHGHGGYIPEVNDQKCQDFFIKTKSWHES